MRLTEDLRGRSVEIPRDDWLEHVLNPLRPDDRLLMEVVLPKLGPRVSDHEAMSLLAKAQLAFDSGNWPETLRVVYMAVEALKSERERLEARYGAAMRDRTLGLMKAANGVYNLARHGNGQMDVSMLDRTAALHALAVGRSLAGLLLRPGSGEGGG